MNNSFKLLYIEFLYHKLSTEKYWKLIDNINFYVDEYINYRNFLNKYYYKNE